MQLLSTLFFVVYSLVIVGVILVVITDNRNPLKSLPWIVVLVLAPGVGLIFYFFFGQDLSKQHIISRRTRRRLTMRLKSTAPEGAAATIPADWQPLTELLEQTNGAVPLYANRIAIYTEGKAKMEALREAIAAARHHIHLQYYILSDDATGRALRDLLIRKAHEGVEVRILYDDVGCSRVKKTFFETMRAAGIEVHAFLHVKFPFLTSKVNYRNHRKIAVIDGQVGFFGGMNIADRYLYGPDWGGRWRDTHFRIEGGGVAGLQAAFLSDWSATTRQRITDPVYYPQPGPDRTGAAVQFVADGPFGPWRSLLQGVSYALARARRRIWIENPYYLPSEVLNTALQTAALAGIDVRLMLPERSDSRLVELASNSFLEKMLKAGVKVYLYRAGFLHAKTILIDDDLTIVGSANMDFRSFEHNFEINAFVYDNDFSVRMRRIFEEDQRQTRALTLAAWNARPRLQRFAESLLRLFAPLM